MARRRKAKSSRILPFALLLILAIIVLIAVNPEARETAQKAWQETKEWWRRVTGAPAPAPQPEAPQSAPAPEIPQQVGTPWRPGLYGQSFTYAGTPLAAGYPNSITVLTNTAFKVGYDEDKRNPAWAAYRVNARRLDQSFPRPSRFEVDQRTRSRVRHDDFTRSGWDRGHMVPNHAIASRFGPEAQRETFLMTNVAPQAPALNQGPWRLLEEVISDRAAIAFEELWVIVGPIYEREPRTLSSGVRIPDAFFCIVVDELPTTPRMQAFVMSQETPRNANFRQFVVTVDQVQRLSGWDFFHELPDHLERELEAKNPGYWLE